MGTPRWSWWRSHSEQTARPASSFLPFHSPAHLRGLRHHYHALARELFCDGVSRRYGTTFTHVSNFQKYVFTCSSFNEIQRQNKSFFPGFFSHTGIEYHILKGVFHPVIEINFCGCHGRGTKDNWVTGDQRYFGWPKPPKSKELGGPKCRWDQRTRWTKSSRNNLIYYRKLSVIQVHRKVIQFWLGYLMFYSKHHAAERWDLEFGSNTTEIQLSYPNSPQRDVCC